MKGEELRACEELRNKIGVTALERTPVGHPSKWRLVLTNARNSGHYLHGHRVQEPLAHGQEEMGESRSTETYKLLGGPNGAAESQTQMGTLGTLGQYGLGGAEHRVWLDKWHGSEHLDATNGEFWSTTPATSVRALATLDTWLTGRQMVG